jgi:neutral trehalase
MPSLVVPTGRLLELYMWNRWLFMNSNDWEIVSDAI